MTTAGKERARTKGGFQICTIYPEKTTEKMDRILELDKSWISVQDFIREKVKKGVEDWEKENQRLE